MTKCQNSNASFWVIFKQCERGKNVNLQSMQLGLDHSARDESSVGFLIMFMNFDLFLYLFCIKDPLICELAGAWKHPKFVGPFRLILVQRRSNSFSSRVLKNLLNAPRNYNKIQIFVWRNRLFQKMGFLINVNFEKCDFWLMWFLKNVNFEICDFWKLWILKYVIFV